MRKRLQKRMLSVLGFLLLFLGFWMPVEAEENIEEVPAAISGAQIRTIEPMGLRFVSYIDTGYLTELDKNQDVEYGTILLPKEYLGNKELIYNGKYTYKGKNYKPLIVPAKKIWCTDTEKHRNYFTAVLAGLQRDDYEKDYVARVYVKTIKDEDLGEENPKAEIVYGNQTETRQVYEVAKAAVEGNVETQEVKDFLQKNVIDLVEKPELPTPDVEAEAGELQMKDITNVRLFGERDGSVQEITEFKSEGFEPENYVVRLDMKEMPSAYFEIEEMRKADDGMIRFVLKGENIVSYDGLEKQDEFIVDYGREEDVSLGEDWIPISTIQELKEKIAAEPDGKFFLKGDLKASSATGGSNIVDTEFTGTLNGRGYEITGSTRTIFNSLKGATVQNLVLTNGNMGTASKAALAITASEGTQVKNVHVKGLMLTARNSSSGGIIGIMQGGSVLEECSVTDLKITGSVKRIGGLVGENIASTIRNCYVEGTISNTTDSAGGLMGRYSENAVVENCYSNVVLDITTSETRWSGGIVGDSDGKMGDAAGAQGGSVKNTLSAAVSTESGTKVARFHGKNIDEANSTNNYELSTSNLMSRETAQGVISQATEEQIYSVQFYRDILKYDETIWNLDNVGEERMPTLRNDDPNNGETGGASSGEAYIPDYARLQKLEGFDPGKELTYANLYRLMPFYDAKYLVEDAKKLSEDHRLQTKKILSVFPMGDDGETKYAMSKSDYETVKKIRITYEDGISSIYNIEKIELANNIASYVIPQLGIHYTYNKYIIDETMPVIQNLRDEIQPGTVTFDNYLKPYGNGESENANVLGVYRKGFLNFVKPEITEMLVKFFANNPEYGGASDNPLVQKLCSSLMTEDHYYNKLLYAYNYINRWYDFEIGGMNMRDVVFFDPSMFGQGYDPIQFVEEFCNKSTVAQRNNQTHTVYQNFVSKITGLKTVDVFVEYFMKTYAGYQDVNDWILDNFEGGVVYEGTPENPQLNFRLWKFIKSNSYHRNGQMILPTLSYNRFEKALYLAAYPTTIVYGNLRNYGNYQDSDAGRERMKAQLKNQIDGYTKMYDVASKILKTGVKDINQCDFAQIDSARNKDLTQDVFYHYQYPLGSVMTDLKSAATAFIFSDFKMSYVVWSSSSFIGSFQIGTHESAHIQDHKVFLENSGKRPGRGGEDYANGFLSQESASYNMNMSQYYDRSSSRVFNLTPERIDSPEEIQSFYKEVFEVLTTIDYLNGQAFLELTPQQQSRVAMQHKYNGNNSKSTWQRVSEEQIKNMNLKNMESLWDNQLTIRPNHRFDVQSINSVGINDWGAYNIERVGMTGWYIPFNDNGTPNAQIFRRNGWEMAGEYGYSDGLVRYMSARTQGGDLKFLQNITGNPDITWKQYRMNKFNAIKEKIDAAESAGTNYFDSEAIISYFKEAMIEDAAKNNMGNINGSMQGIEAAREAVYRYLQRLTDDFSTRVYDNAVELVPITTGEQFIEEVRKNPNGAFSLENDIEITDPGEGSTVLDVTFIGRLEGNGHSIYGLTKPLFKSMANSYVEDLYLRTDATSIHSDSLLTAGKYSVINVKKTKEGGKEISNLLDLIRIGDNPTGEYVLTQDIDASSYEGTTPIIGKDFGGKLNGQGHSITGLNQPLMNKMANGTVENLILADAKIDGGTGEYNGILAKQTSGANVKNVHVVNGSVKGGRRTGGLIGRADAAMIEQCTVDAEVSGSTGPVGGMLGELANGHVSDSYSLGTVHLSAASGSVGGFAGYADNSSIYRCFTVSSVTTNSKTRAGGFIGWLTKNQGIHNNISFAETIDGQSWKFDGATAAAEFNEQYVKNYEVKELPGNPTSESNRGSFEGKIDVTTVKNIQQISFYEELGYSEEVWDFTNIESGGAPKLKNLDANQITDIIPKQEVSTLEELCEIGSGGEKAYILTADIDASSAPAYENIVGQVFAGTLDGNGHRITGLQTALFKELNGTVTDLKLEDTKLFSVSPLLAERADHAVIENVQIRNVTVTSGSGTSTPFGMLISEDNGSEITNVAADEFSVTMLSTLSGGLIGKKTGGSLSDIFVRGTLNVNSKAPIAIAGGIAGELKDVKANHLIAKVSMESSAAKNTGGIVGTIGGTTMITDSLSLSNMNSEGRRFAYSDEAILEGVHNSFEHEKAKGNSNVTEETTERDILRNVGRTETITKDFYLNSMNLEEEFWNLEDLDLWGYPRPKGIDFEVKTVEIHNASDLLNASGQTGAKFVLKADIDLSGTAQNTPVLQQILGNFDGEGHKITGLNQPLFDELYGNTVQNLMIEGAALTGSEEDMGILAQRTYGANITNVHISGGSVKGSESVGGLIGSIYNTTISECSVQAEVEASGSRAGGLIGKAQESAIQDSYTLGNVHGNGDCQGGFVGSVVNTQIEHSFSAAWVHAEEAPNAGGFIGKSSQNLSGIVGNVSFSRGNDGYRFDGMTETEGFTGDYRGNYEYSPSRLTPTQDRLELDLTGKITQVNADMAKTVEFYTEQLGFDAEKWDFTSIVNGELPHLRGYDGNREEIVVENGEIATLEELLAINDNPDKEYYLIRNIDVSSVSGKTALISAEFSGILEGNGHKLIGLNMPVFDTIRGGSVSGLRFDNVNMTVDGSGILAHEVYNAAISDIHVYHAELMFAGDYSGGVIGRSFDTVIDRVMMRKLSGKVDSGLRAIGGIIGEMNGGSMSNVLAQGDFGSTMNPNYYYGVNVGGIAGAVKSYDETGAVITKSIAKMTMKRPRNLGTENYNGGFAGTIESGSRITDSVVLGMCWDLAINNRTPRTYNFTSSVGVVQNALDNCFEHDECQGQTNANGTTLKQWITGLGPDYYTDGKEKGGIGFDTNIWNMNGNPDDTWPFYPILK